ncbi:hypothetical protein [Nafulsella turpanensis]|uniref:hypothetical protein n=1 Tax=Nafulsella turpanensis TaxID=1265690 RepID=UPI0003494241|nr:hypothetical protein [Nafulsella turpanensis]
MQQISSSPIYLEFSTVFANTKAYMDEHNSSQSRLTDCLSNSHRATVFSIVRLYLKQLKRASLLQPVLPDQLPSFRTFNISLAKEQGCTVRTIINHKERLKKAGIIIGEERRGSGGTELWINPKLLLGEVFPAQKLNTIPSISDIFCANVKNFHPLVHEPHEQENANSTVGKSISPDIANPEDKGVRKVADENGEPSIATGTLQEHHKNMGENGKCSASKQAISAPPKQKHEQKNGEEAERIFLLSLIRQFWQHARTILYPDIILSDPENNEVLNLIWESVYGKFRVRYSQSQWIAYHNTALARVDMVKRWLDRDVNHWIPQKPHVYFDPQNQKNGFINTWEWYVRQETLKIEIRNQLELEKVKKETLTHNQEKGRFKNHSRLQLFRIHEKRLSKFKDEALMQAYYAGLQYSLQIKIHSNDIRNRKA